ncbi:molybdenum cofactor biosynthesis bifunctional protein [Parachaetomium inaequale]|uniref:Molybdenum cofactor biosynthesis bifunctional protein n=1 Tax=Parachaetomium inaequale TaxID=2588326 RepID=A0AAN6PGG7_9PEZI|nr:molybdenum cofactor biosynthesis bifunctional protein [Parachaetomium inaequale]
MTFTPLILAGGKSTRMNSPKHLLPMPDGRPLYQHQIDLLARTCPDAPTVYISLAQDSQLDDYLRTLPTTSTTTTTPLTNSTPTTHIQHEDDVRARVRIIPDLTSNPSPSSAGPASGLLAAYTYDPSKTWLVIPCDHPLLTPAALQHLCAAYEPPVTCFRNADGFCEPLVGVWGPEGLRALADAVEERAGGGEGGGGGGKRGIGPSRVVRGLGGREVDVEEVVGGG